MSAATIGVVIPSFQMERWLGRCLDSVLTQTVPPTEVVVVDDGSTDATSTIAGERPGVKLIRQDNRGLAGARNTGAGAVETDWTLFLDADDVLLPGAMEAFHDAIAEWTTAAVIDPAYEAEYADGRIVSPPVRPTRTYRRSDFTRVLRGNPLAANALIKREITTHYPYDETLKSSEDLDLWFRLLLEGHQIVQLGTPTTRRAVERPGALSSHVAAMRRSRRTVFSRLWRDPRLSVTERGVLAYQLARTSLGVAVSSRRQG